MALDNSPPRQKGFVLSGLVRDVVSLVSVLSVQEFAP
jgi:hypothetical protein